MNEIDDYLNARLHARREANSLRQLPKRGDGIDFCSNDYLGLASEPFAAPDSGPHGSTGSRLISGNDPAYTELEEHLAGFFAAESALVYGSGYQANLGLLSCIATRQDTMLYDQLVHASIRDGLLLSNARTFSFRHNDVEQLKEKLERASGRVFVVVESVYSMDGDEAPLPELLQLCEAAGAALIVDEAHAVGVFGTQGRGLTDEWQLSEKVWARVITFGKALGGHGAAILGNRTLKDYLINFSRPFIYTTALPPIAVHRVNWALDYVKTTDRIIALQRKVSLFKETLLPATKRQLIPSRSAIQSLLVPGNEAVKSLAENLRAAGFHILPILHPTVPEGRERIRICLHSFNRDEDIIALAITLDALMQQY